MPRVHLPLGLVVLTACPVEQTYADLIKEHGNTYWTESTNGTTDSAASEATTSEPGAPTSTNSGAASAGGSDSHGETVDLTDGSTSSGEDETDPGSSSTTLLAIDEPPQLGDFMVAPKPVLAAAFVDLSVECSDDVAVAEVRFLVDGEILAAVTEAPFAAKWPVKSLDQIGDHNLAAECEDSAGQVASTGEEISVNLPAPGSAAWSKVHTAERWHAEAADAAAAPDGSWWVCGYADNAEGGTAVWVAHYSPAGVELFSETISRGKDQTGRCSGIDVASEDGHRAVLTGGFGPTGLWPSLWTALVDETEDPPVLAESNKALIGYWGNDVLVNKYGQFEVAGQRIVNGDDLDMVHQVYNYMPGEEELTASSGLTFGAVGFPDAAAAIVANLDGTMTLVGTITKDQRLTAAAVKLDAQHQVVTEGGWPFWAPLPFPEAAGALDGALDELGNLRLTGWWRDSPNQDSKVLVLTVNPLGDLLGGLTVEQDPMIGDNSGSGIAILGDGTTVTVASITTTAPENLDMWLRRGPEDGSILFQGAYNLRDEPRRVRANALDQTLVVGYETTVVLQDGMPVVVRQAWLRAFN
jgi:hypothetical protein